jgi:hypothetical protein
MKKELAKRFGLICLLIVFFVLLPLLLVSCGSKKDPKNVPPPIYKQEEVIAIRNAHLEQWPKKNGFFLFTDNNDNANANLWHGALALSGHQPSCALLKDLHGPDGRLKRSPWNTNTTNEASRDELLGRIAYWVACHDKETAAMWLDSFQKMGKLCEHPTDDRCDLNPIQHQAMWGLLYYAWKHLGLDPSDNMKLGVAFHSDEHLLVEEIKLSKLGYRVHLPCFNLLVRRHLGAWTNVTQQGADLCVAREPENAFYRYIAEGASEAAITKFLQLVPTIPLASQTRWLWQEDDIQGKKDTIHSASVVFLANLFLSY